MCGWRRSARGTDDTPFRYGLAAQQFQNFLELEPELPHNLLALAHIAARFLAGQLVARTADRESLLVEKAADLSNDDHILPLVIASVASTLNRL